MIHTSYIQFPQDTGDGNSFLAKPKTAVSAEEQKDEPKKAVKKKANPFIGDIEKEKQRLENKKKEDAKEKNKKKKDLSKKNDKKTTEKSTSDKKEPTKVKGKTKKEITKKSSDIPEQSLSKEKNTTKKNATENVTTASEKEEEKQSATAQIVDTTVKATIKKEDKPATYTVALHTVKIKSLIPEYRKTANEDGIFIGLVAAISVLAWLGYYQRKRLVQLLNSFFAIRYFNQLVREDNATLQRVFILMSLVFAVIAPLFLYQTITFYKINLIDAQGLGLFLLCVLIVACAYFTKIVLITFLSFVTQTQSRGKEYIYNVFLTNNMLGIALIPLVMLFEYGLANTQGYAIKIGVAFFFVAFFYRAFRAALMVTSKRGFSIYHLFLYFCTFELLPLVILTKIISTKI